MAKLVAEKGKIMKQTTFQAGPVNVVIKNSWISTDGDLGLVALDDGKNHIELTGPQAKSFAEQIIKVFV